jgi:hypothetical protein
MDLRYSAEEALAVAMKNDGRVWSGKSQSTAAARLKSREFFMVQHQPRFQINPNEPIFTMGSCFAREVENTLIALGVPLVTEGHGISPEHFESWDEATRWGGGVCQGKLSRGAFNKYCVHSMTHELKRVLLGEKHAHEGMFEINDGLWFDPHASGLKNAQWDQALENRQRIFDSVAEIRNADVVFLTLGLTESWIDTQTGLAMNRHPGGAALRRYGSRFEFVDYGFSAILNELTEIISLIREECNPRMRFLLTISPVPLGATFRTTDVVVSNSASKSTLRAVAEEVFRCVDYVDYFPSYEMVINTPRELAWEPDQLHVSRPMVEHVMRFFQSTYLSSPPIR